MKQLYFFDESERERILNLHESATKNQYLINEQSSADNIAREIHNASYGPGTGKGFLDAIQKISTLQQLIDVDNILKNSYSRLGLQGQINDEFNPQEATDRASLTTFQNHLAKLGATMTFDQKRDESVAINFQSKVQGQTETQKTEEQQVADWSQKFPCVINYPGVQKIANPRADANVSGTVAARLTVDLTGADASTQTATFNAAAASGGITATITAGGSGKLVVTGGAGNDSFTVNQADATNSVMSITRSKSSA
jgi:hypothetical protein